MTGGRPADPAKDVGIMAVLAMAVCCGVPLLLGTTSLAITGAVFGSSVVVIGAVALAVLAFGRGRSRARDADDCCDPVGNRRAGPDRTARDMRPRP